LVLTGAAGGDVDLSDVTITAGVHVFAGSHDVTLTGVTAEDVRAFTQLGRFSVATTSTAGIAVERPTTYTALTTTDADITGGSLNDVIQVSDAADTGTIATGSGSDIVIVPVAAAGTLEISDFVKGTDRVIFTGTLDATINVSAATVAAGQYTFDTNAIINLANGGSDLTATDMSDSVQLGISGTVATAGGAGTFKGGKFDDYMAGGAGVQAFEFVQDGGVDTITAFVIAEDTLSFDDMTGIGAAGTVIAANADKVADAASGTVYVFADGGDGTGAQSIDFNGANGDVGFGSTEVLADVASFLDAALTTANGENYVALINTTQGGTDIYAIYYITADSDGIQADDIRLIGSVDADADITAVEIV
jgi:hypothetical protein